MLGKGAWLTPTPQEMASGERQVANRKIAEENLFNSFGAAEQQAETEAFQCGRCKQVGRSVLLRIPLLTSPEEEMPLPPGANSQC